MMLRARQRSSAELHSRDSSLLDAESGQSETQRAKTPRDPSHLCDANAGAKRGAISKGVAAAAERM